MLDATDKKILNHLQINAKKTIKELANELNLTTSPIFERIKKLEKKGIIKNYTTILDSKKINLGQVVFCNVGIPNYLPKNIIEFEKKIRSTPEILACYHIAG